MWFKSCGRFALVWLFTTAVADWRAVAAEATNSIVWHAEANTLDVDIDNKPLSVVVADFKKATGREIHVPPGMTKNISLKFSGKPMSEGLARILDGFNYYGETHGEVSRIVIVDPNGAPPVPTGVRMAMPRPPASTGSMGSRPPGGSSGFSGQPGGFTGSRGDGRGGDGRSGGSTSSDRDRKPKTQEQIALEMLVREAAKSSGAGGGGDRIRPSSGSGAPSSSGKSKSPR